MKKPIFFLLMSLLLMRTSSAFPLMREHPENEDGRASGGQVTNEARREEEVANSSDEEQLDELEENQSIQPRGNVDASIINTLDEEMQRNVRTTTKLKTAIEILKEKKEAADQYNQARREIDPDAVSVMTLHTASLVKLTRGPAKMRAGTQALSGIQQQNRKRNKKRSSNIRQQVAPFIENGSEENQEADQQIENELSQQTADLQIQEAVSSKEEDFTKVAANFQNKIQQIYNDLSKCEDDATSSWNQAEIDGTPESWQIAKEALQKNKSILALLKALCEIDPDNYKNELEEVDAKQKSLEEKEKDLSAKILDLQNKIIAHSNYMNANAQKIRDEFIRKTESQLNFPDKRTRQYGYFGSVISSYYEALDYWNKAQEAQAKKNSKSANLFILASKEALEAVPKWDLAARNWKRGSYNRQTNEGRHTEAAMEHFRNAANFARQAEQNLNAENK